MLKFSAIRYLVTDFGIIQIPRDTCKINYVNYMEVIIQPERDIAKFPVLVQ